MIRLHPRSTLFPYTTLSRSSQQQSAPSGRTGPPQDQTGRFVAAILGNTEEGFREILPAQANREYTPARRSEEHTSELQSRQYLVCRLLLEKKHTSHANQSLA